MAKKNGPTQNDTDRILDVVAQVKGAIEARNWAGLKALLPDAPVWVATRPVPLAGAIASLEAGLGGARDIEVTILEIKDTVYEADRAQLNARAQLIYSSGESWEEHSFEFTLHIGFVRRPETWAVDYVGVTAPEPQRAAPVDLPPSILAAPGGGYFAAPDTGYFAASALAAPYFEAASYFRTATPYFGGGGGFPPEALAENLAAPEPSPAAPEQPQPQPPQALPGYSVIYAPLLVPTNVILSLFK